MADGIRLGGAYYELSADSAPLIQALARAEAASKKSAQQIAAATGVPEAAVRRYAATLIREEKRAADAAAQSALRIIKAHNDAADAADKAAQKAAAGNQRATAGFVNVTKGALGFAAAAAGVATGAAAINAAMSSVAESTKRAADAQFALNKLYGASAPLVTQQAEALAKLSGRSNTEAKEAAASVATLARNYALSGAQIQTVLKVTADLAAVRGIGLAEASERVAGAVRGEAEAIEYLGQSLQSDFLKAMADMTDEQRKQFETLNPLTKAQIVLNQLTKDTADLQGAAAEKAATAQGAFAQLQASSDNLAVAIGDQLAPGLAVAARTMADAADAAIPLIGRLGELQRLGQSGGALAGLEKLGAVLFPLIAVGQIIRGANTSSTTLTEVGSGPMGPALTPEIAQVSQDDVNRRRREAAAQADAIKAFAAQRKRQIADIAEAEEQAARRAADAEAKRIEAVKVGLEVEKEARLRALEARERATIKALEAEAAASKKASEDTIEQLEREKDARLAAAEAAKDAALAAIKAREQELDMSRELEDRSRDDERRAEDRATEDARRVEDRVRDAAQEREIKRLEALRDARVKAVEDEIEAADRASEKRIRNIDKQEAAARSASEKALRRIDERADREDEAHRRLMQALDDERDARLEALDVQLRALDAAEKSEDSARRLADLQKRVTDAQRAATQARGTGTPEQVAEARDELVRALRVGNETSVANARERLAQLAGQGAEAIKKADEELAKAQQDLRDEGVDQARDAERQKLKDAQDAIKEDIDARKRAAEEDDRRRKQDVEDDKRAEQDKLRNRLDALAKKKQAEQDASKDQSRQLRARLDAEKAAADEDIQRARDVFDAQTEVLNDRRRDEDRFRDDQRTAQDRFRDDERNAQDRALSVQREAVTAAFEQERRDTDAHYNGPNGVITIARKAQEAVAQAYRDRINNAKTDFDAEKQQINDVYRNTAKTGLLDLQDQAAENNREKLADQLGALSSWKDQANDFVESNTGKWKTLAEAIEAVDKAIRKLPGGRIQPPGGVGPVAPPGYGGQPGDPGGNAAFAPVVRGASPDSYWTSGGTHGGHPAADIFAAIGTPIYAPVSGTLSAHVYPQGGNAAFLEGDDGRTYYFAHGNVPFEDGAVRRGQQIGQVGDTGNARGGRPHLHFAISDQGEGVFGQFNGSGNISGDSSYWRTGRDSADSDDDSLDYVGPDGNDSERFQKLLRAARSAAREYDLPASIMAAIPINEGRESSLQRDYHNIFSIKGTGPAGTVVLPTEEVIDGRRVTVNANFRVYNNEAESFRDFGDLLRNSGIYDDAMAIWDRTRDVKAFMHAVGRRYATDPNFPNQVLSIAGYDRGKLFQWPTLTYTPATGERAMIAERRPEMLLGGGPTAARIDRSSLIGPMPQRDQAAVGASLAAMATPAAVGGPSEVNNWSISGIGLDDVARTIQKQQRRHSLLRGMLGGGRG